VLTAESFHFPSEIRKSPRLKDLSLSERSPLTAELTTVPARMAKQIKKNRKEKKPEVDPPGNVTSREGKILSKRKSQRVQEREREEKYRRELRMMQDPRPSRTPIHLPHRSKQ